MKKVIFYLLSAAAISVFLSSHLFAQENRKYNFDDFTGVAVGWGMHVNISQASSYSVEVKADKRDFDVLEVEKKGNSLQFYIDRNNYRKHDDIYITIKMPVLSEIDLSGGSIGDISMNIASKDFAGNLSGGSELNGKLECGDVNFNLSGGSNVNLKGKGRNLSFDGSGGSIYHLKGFLAKDLNANLSGGSRVTVTMNGEINSNLSGGSNITYYGTASNVSSHSSGGSSVEKGD